MDALSRSSGSSSSTPPFTSTRNVEPWCLASPESRTLAPVLSQGAAHVIIYHLLCEGRAYVQLEDGERVTLLPGDIVTFPHGHGHTLGSGSRVTPIDVGATLPAVLERGLDLLHIGGGGAASRFICGYLACNPQLSQTFLGGLPALLKVNIRDDPSGQWLENSLKFSVTQAGKPGGRKQRDADKAVGGCVRRDAEALPS